MINSVGERVVLCYDGPENIGVLSYIHLGWILLFLGCPTNVTAE